MSANFTPEKEDYGVLSPFKMQVLTNFPYIEADFDALTNYHLLCKIVDYLNNVITNENEVTEQVTSLYNAYVALQNYVNTYFDNLDLQGEVSIKIDEMAEDGTLTNLISAYIDPLYQAYETAINLDIANQNTEITNFKNGVTNALTNMNNLVVATSGSPAGVYATVAALEAADPDHTKIYVVTADGKWYYYNTGTSAWTAGGTYQATAISDSDPTIAYILDEIDDLQKAKDDCIDTIYYTDSEYQSTNLLTNVIWYDETMTQTDGTRVHNQYSGNYNTTEVIDVEPEFTYKISNLLPVGGRLFTVFFDNEMGNGESVDQGWVSDIGSKTFEIPSGKSKMAINIAIDGGGTKASNLYRMTQYNYEKDFRLPRLLFNHELYGKKIVNLGDSIFGNNDSDGTGISSYLARYTGATVYNCAFGGTRAGLHPTANWDTLSGYRLATAIATNIWTDQDAAMVAAQDFPEYFSTHLATLKSLDFSEIDIVTLSWGSNDFTGGLNPNYNPDTENPQFYYGNTLRNIVSTLETAYPNLKIFIITPFYRFWLNETTFVDDSNTHEETSWVGTHTGTLIDFVNNAIEAGEATQTPVIDTYYNMGFNQYNRSQYYPVNDGAHQNKNGRKLIASYLSKELW